MKHFKPPYTAESIREQYRSLSKRYHPDAPGGSDQKMMEVNAEHDFIIDLLKLAPDVKRSPASPGKKILVRRKVRRVKRSPVRTIVILPDAKTVLQILKEFRKFK